MDMGQFRKSDRESALPLGRVGFQLLLASASARQASSQTARAVVLQAMDQHEEGQPDLYRIQILSNRVHPLRSQKPRLARFSDLDLPRHYQGEIPASGNELAEGDTTI